ncbi:MAG: helix-turn-helix transcriptional regulator [Bacteroidales bacterium]|nr:helix-turn-helix transcriptional regulator [Bacteroidales bacterium]
MKNQLIKILETEGLSPAKFADEIGVQRSSISHILSGRNKPSYDFIMKIVERFPGINTEWLLTGYGSIFKTSEKKKYGISEQTDLFSSKETEKPAKTDINIENNKKSDINSIRLDDKKNLSDTNTSNAEIKSVKKEFTNVNNIDFVLIFYKDGTFERFKSK